LKFEWEVEQNDDLFPLFKLYHMLFKPSGYKEKIKYNLKFGKENLSYHKEDAILWHIEYTKLDYLELPKSFAPRTAFDNSYPIFVHTNDNDKYYFECTLNPKEINESKAEIEQRAGNV
jgi:hypothetical protein